MDEKDQAQAKLESLSQSVPIGVYQHYKGPYYTVFALSIKEDTCTPLIHYYSHDHGTRWSRDAIDFCGYAKDNIPRFKFVREATETELWKAAFRK